MAKGVRFKLKDGTILYPAPYYPIGSIYISTLSTNPATIFGGTWERIKDRFLLACGDSYSNGATGGSATHVHSTADHTLTIAQMPSHTHVQNPHKHTIAYTANQSSSGHPTVTHRGIAELHHVGFIQNTTATNKNTGGGGAHNHGNTGSANGMPPYLAVYVWKRTA